jgi:sulfate transport system ATP-binding protein
VRPIAPAPAFGDDGILVEAMRSQEEANQLPLQPGQRVWVGVRHVHALDHVGLRFLVLNDGSPSAQGALALAGHMARLSHARVTLLGYGLASANGNSQQQMQEAKEQLGSGLAALELRTTAVPLQDAVEQELERRPYDLVVFGVPSQERLAQVEQLLQSGDHHLLVVPKAQSAPLNALIGVASGEPGKDDVLFAGRLLRHLGAAAKVMTVLPATKKEQEHQWRAERFLANGVRTLELLGVTATTALKHGSIESVIMNELRTDAHDLLVMGAPLPDKEGHVSLDGVIGRLLNTLNDCPLLIVRSAVPSKSEPATPLLNGQIKRLERLDILKEIA